MVLISHEHMDHAKAVKDLMRLGIDCYMTRGTAEALDIDGPRCHIVQVGKGCWLGNMLVYPFETEHDAAESCGFLIDDQDSTPDGHDVVLYATDTYYLKNRFNGVTKFMVEVNHSYEIIQENIENKSLNKFLAQRLMKSHFALENVLEFFKANDLSQAKEIWLLHMSSNNSDPAAFKTAVMRATGVPTYIASVEAKKRRKRNV